MAPIGFVKKQRENKNEINGCIEKQSVLMLLRE